MNNDRENARIEGFSDSVFAIAITILVLEIKVPLHDEVASVGLGKALLNLWPSFLSLLTSFVTILVIWVHHHWIFSLIKRNDQTFLYLNGALLFFVTVVPFPTALMAEYLLNTEARIAAHLYTGTFLAISLAYDALWRYASSNLMGVEATRLKQVEAAQITRQYRLGPPLYLIVFGISFISEAGSLIVCLLVAFYFALWGRRMKG